MPDLLNRHSYEERFAMYLAAELQRERRRLVEFGVERIGERPAVEWEKDKEELAAVILMLLRDPWSASYHRLAGGEGLIARPDAIERAFEEWAAAYAVEAAGQMVDTNKEIAAAAAALLIASTVAGGLGASVATIPANPFPPQAGGGTPTIPGGVSPGGTAPSVTLSRPPQLPLADISSTKRITRAAISQVTDASSAGEMAVAAEFNRQEAARVATETAAADIIAASGGKRPEVRQAGKLAAYWHTERDGRVCPICAPLDGEPESTWRDKFPNGPKAHVACRCYLDWRVE